MHTKKISRDFVSEHIKFLQFFELYSLQGVKESQFEQLNFGNILLQPTYFLHYIHSLVIQFQEHLFLFYTNKMRTRNPFFEIWYLNQQYPKQKTASQRRRGLNNS